MGNGGWHGTQEEWDRIERPLLGVDQILADFAAEAGLLLTKNHKDWPERSVRWGDDVRCLIQLYLVDADALTFNLWLCASQDRGRKRYWKQETPIKEKRIDDIREDLAQELKDGRRKLISWCQNVEQLEFATDLQ